MASVSCVSCGGGGGKGKTMELCGSGGGGRKIIEKVSNIPRGSWVIEIIRICVGYVWTGKFDLNADTCGKTTGRNK